MTSIFSPDTLEGRTAVITGSSRGIGAGIAGAFAGLGAVVHLVANDPEGLEQTQAEIAAAGGTAHAHDVDLSDHEAIRRLADAIPDVDTLVNNAAPAQQPMSLLDSTDELWMKMFALNLWAPLALIKAFAPAMIERSRGCIINTSSVSVKTPAPRIAPYVASKSALEGLTKVAALEFAPHGVRVNAVAPSMTRTARTQAMLDDPTFAARTTERIPLGRLAEVDDLAAAAVYLASDAAGFITGQTFYIEGGSSVGIFSSPPPVASPQ